MEKQNTNLFQSILALNIVPETKLKELLEQANQESRDLHDLLLEHDLIADENIGKLKADLYNVPFIKLSDQEIKKEITTLIPQEYAKEHLCLAIRKDGDHYLIACSNPNDNSTLAQLNTRFADKIKIVYATKKDLKKALKIYTEDATTIFNRLLTTGLGTAEKESSEPPIILIVETILRFASEKTASDIHIEPTDKESVVRFRIDGVMHDIVTLPKNIHPRIATRIKVMANLRTDETQAAQDGKISFEIDDEKIDIRVSIIPILNGENIVLRLLSERSRQFSLIDLGLSESNAKLLNAARVKPHGMILSTGPTGSGKTTTLYALLKLLNSRKVTIMTIEDPVEYEIEGVNQIQVNKATGLSFAEGLRSIVRQDPDIILIGEIRDNETANIAVNSAMTGHLVLSTLHTNDAATTIPRLIDMQIEPFLIASTVNIIVAQRLVRKICTQCRTSEEIEIAEIQKIIPANIVKEYFGADQKTRVYKGVGCPVCQNLGYSGRIGIFEIMVISDAIKDAIINKRDAGAIAKIAINEGMKTILEDGMAKVKSGLTTIEEVLRVSKA